MRNNSRAAKYNDKHVGANRKKKVLIYREIRKYITNNFSDFYYHR